MGRSFGCLALLVGIAGCGGNAPPPSAEEQAAVSRDSQEKEVTTPLARRELSSESIAKIEQFCGDCHAMPRPEFFPRHAWRQEVDRGYRFYFASNRSDLELPVMAETVAFFEDRAPDSIGVMATTLEVSPQATPFLSPEPEPFQPIERNTLPAVAGLFAEPIGADGQKVPLLCDMRSGEVAMLELAGGEFQLRTLATLNHPCRATACDLDADGRQDLVVPELGSFGPEDHDLGKVVWLRGSDQVGVMQTHVLMEGIGRVADVRPADFDADGDLDLVVAEFGYFETGAIWLLRREGVDEQGLPRFEQVKLDSRHGTIHVPVVDFDRDGDLDFLALVSQEYEAICWFDNQGDGTFECRTIYDAPDPSFGSSGIEVVDLDGDGDDDVVYANGDTFDSYFLKPYHGIRWLERVSGPSDESPDPSLDFHFVEHLLAEMPGVQHVGVGDLDSDGDPDLIGAAFLPWNLQTEHRETRLVSLVQLRNEGAGKFTVTPLEIGPCVHAATLLFDADGDGDLDLLVGGFHAEEQRVRRSVGFWRNQMTAR